MQSSREFSWENKEVVVTGGCGFIGNHLVKRLRECGADVEVIDVIGKGDEYGDVCDYEYLLWKTQKVDYIYHLAAIVGVNESLQMPVKVLDVNLQGTINVLNAAKQNGVKRVIFTSSSEVYGEPIGEMTEVARTAPLSIYGIAKVTAEAYCWAYWRDYGLETVALRFCLMCMEKDSARHLLSQNSLRM